MEANVALVFVDDNGEFGNPVGIVDDEEHRLIDSLGVTSEISIFNPQHKVKFAGHAVLGTAYFISNVLNKNVDSIKCGDEIVTTKRENGVAYINAPLSIMPSWNYEQLDSGDQVEALLMDKISLMKHTFAPDWGIPEDQANGSGSMKLAASLNCNLEITHGLGSIIHARSLGPEYAEVGGLVKMTEKITL